MKERTNIIKVLGAMRTLAVTAESTLDRLADTIDRRERLRVLAFIDKLNEAELISGTVDGFDATHRTITLRFEKLPEPVAIGDKWIVAP